MARHGERGEPQGRQVGQAAAVDLRERLPVTLQSRRMVQPLFQPAGHVAARLALAATVGVLRGRRVQLPERRDDVKLRRPLAVRGHGHAERQPVLVDRSFRAGADPGLADERLTLVPEDEAPVGHPVPVASFLRQSVLHLEEVGEIAGCVNPDSQVGWLAAVVKDAQFLMEAVGHLPLPDDGKGGVDIDVGRARHQEKARLEILQVVGGQGAQPLPVYGQYPPGQEAGVEREEAGRVRAGGFDVALFIADHEGVAFEYLDQLAAHVVLRPAAAVSPQIGVTRPVEFGDPGRHRWNVMTAAMLPSQVSKPRSSAA